MAKFFPGEYPASSVNFTAVSTSLAFGTSWQCCARCLLRVIIEWVGFSRANYLHNGLPSIAAPKLSPQLLPAPKTQLWDSLWSSRSSAPLNTEQRNAPSLALSSSYSLCTCRIYCMLTRLQAGRASSFQSCSPFTLCQAPCFANS